MEGLVFKQWIEEIGRYKDNEFAFTLVDDTGISIMVENTWFYWRKYYKWEDIKPYTLYELLDKFTAEFNFKCEEYKRRIDNGEK